MDDDRERAAESPASSESAEAEGGELLELVLAEHAAREAQSPPARIDGVVVGTLRGFAPTGEALVDFPGHGAEPIAARAMAVIGPEHLGRSIAILFEGGDPSKPVVMGLMHRPQAPVPAVEAAGDGERLVFEAEKEIVLRCGEASITLTRAGKVLIKGAYLLTRASGVNRIQGGAVEIN
ncbi:Hypothetical protein A7982_02627 [Minicystis rosea]|nr:Hypothetical protein A7982_02627 [Minicystis rosea]